MNRKLLRLLCLCFVLLIIVIACSPTTKNPEVQAPPTPPMHVHISDLSLKQIKTNWNALKENEKLKILKEMPGYTILYNPAKYNVLMSTYLYSVYVPKSEELFGVAISEIDPSIKKIALLDKDAFIEEDIDRPDENHFKLIGDFNHNHIPDTVYIGVYQDHKDNIGQVIVVRESSPTQNNLYLTKWLTGNESNFGVLMNYSNGRNFSIFYCFPGDFSDDIVWNGKGYVIKDVE